MLALSRPHHIVNQGNSILSRTKALFQRVQQCHVSCNGTQRSKLVSRQGPLYPCSFCSCYLLLKNLHLQSCVCSVYQARNSIGLDPTDTLVSNRAGRLKTPLCLVARLPTTTCSGASIGGSIGGITSGATPITTTAGGISAVCCAASAHAAGAFFLGRLRALDAGMADCSCALAVEWSMRRV